MFGNIEEAYDMGAAAVGATIYFGSDNASRQIIEVAKPSSAHELGMATILWCYLRNNAFKTDKDYTSPPTSPPSQPPCVTIGPTSSSRSCENNGGFTALNMGNSSYGKIDKRVYTELTTDHPIDLCRYQVANCYMGRAA
jgi:class I fructose-bisphosphate aldolase